MVRLPAPFFCLLLISLLAACAPRAPQKKPKEKVQVRAPIRPSAEQRLERQFQAARPLLASIPHLEPRTSFSELRRRIRRTASTAQAAQAALDWVELVEKKPQALARAFDLDLVEGLGAPELVSTASGELLPPAAASMWRHCRLAFATQKGGQVQLKSGWQSAARQIWRMAQSGEALRPALQRWGLPGSSPFQSTEPPLAIEVTKGDPKELPPLCHPFGLRLKGPHLLFSGTAALYAPSLAKLEPPLADSLTLALEQARFFPSPQGLRVILAMGFKESSLQWDPAMNKPKKEALRQQFLSALSSTESGWGATLTEMVLPESLLRDKQALAAQLKRILAPRRRSTEYEFYVWTRQAHRFLQRLLSEYGQLAQLGSQVLNLETKLSRLAFEPQTFGLFQINVNHLGERLNSERNLRRRFAALLPGGRVDRHGLVRSLSGLENAPLSHAETLELIFRAELAPRYEDHLQGHPADLYYFAAENLTGPLSTYKAALQQQLASKLGRKLTLDGDLAFSLPYSRRLDPSRRSNSQKALLRFAQRQREITAPNRAVSRLLSATRYDRLAATPLYGLIMQDQTGARLYPELQSKLYGQSPQRYAIKVLKLAEQY